MLEALFKCLMILDVPSYLRVKEQIEIYWKFNDDHDADMSWRGLRDEVYQLSIYSNVLSLLIKVDASHGGFVQEFFFFSRISAGYLENILVFYLFRLLKLRGLAQ